LYRPDDDGLIAKNYITLSLILDEKTTYIFFENGGGAGIVSRKRRYHAYGLS
jgi:hypothetical protein